MIKYLLTLLIFFCMLSPGAHAEPASHADTLSYDIEKIINYQNNDKYDYNSQLTYKEPNLWELIMRWVSRGLRKIFGSQFAETYTKPFLIAVFVIFILLILFFIYKKRPELFVRNKKRTLEHQLEEDTIHEVNFDSELEKSLRAGDYKMAVRLTYLQTLKYLNDHSYLDWQPHKTPTEYIYEMKKTDSKTEFRQLTNHFLRVRYGNFDATQQTYQAVRDLAVLVKKGGQHEG